MFFIFNVVLVTSDIVTDFITAVNFFDDGHFYWAICTIVPMFAPFAVRFSLALVELAKVSIRKVAFVSLTNVLQSKVAICKMQYNVTFEIFSLKYILLVAILMLI
jgi:hypothetical protein